MHQKHIIPVQGLDLKFSTGTYGNLAGGAVIVTVGETNLMVTADRKSTRLNSSHSDRSRMPSSA